MLSDIKDLEKRLDKFEEETRFKLKRMEDSFALFRDVVIKMQEEKSELEKKLLLLENERRLLKEKRKEIVSEPMRGVIGGVGKVVTPIKEGFKETVNEAINVAFEENGGYIELKEEKKKPEEPKERPMISGEKEKVVKWWREKLGIDPKKDKNENVNIGKSSRKGSGKIK